MRKLIAVTVLVLVLVAAKTRSVRHPAPPPKPLIPTRSFVITDIATVTPITLDRVLAQLIARSGVQGLSPQQLLRQMFDTQNPQPGLADPAGPHCDDTLIDGKPSFNGFPRRCPTPEGPLAATPYVEDEYFTMGVINRFDLAPADGSNCGQYRLVFARRGPSVVNRIHFIFEAVLANPNPSAGLAACRPVAQFWSDLSSVDSMDERRARIDKFFFEGLPGFAPVIDPPHFADAGGIRTIHQTLPAPGNRSYQFRLAKECTGGDCTLRMVPDVLENQPYALLFDANATDTPSGRAFRDEFVQQVETLAINDVNLFRMRVSKEYLLVESNPTDSFPAFGIDLAFTNGNKTSKGTAFRDRIQAELDRLGSTLTPDQIILRAQVETCIGCHGLGGSNIGGGVILTGGLFGQTMISEDELMDGEAGPKTRYGVDPIIEKQFVPHRMKVLLEFLASGKAAVHSK